MGWWTSLKRTGPGEFVSDVGDGIYRGTGNIVDGLTGEAQADAAESAAKKQAAAGQEANSILKEYLDQVRADQKPFYDMGLQNAQSLNTAMANGEFNSPAFNYQDPGEFKFAAFDPSQVTRDPGYQLMMQEGTDGIQNMAAARGSLRSGGTLKALTRFKTGLASQEIGNAYNRYSADRGQAQNAWNTNRAFGYGKAMDSYNRGESERTNRFNRLSQLAGYGQGAAAANQSAGGMYAQGAGNNLMGAANAQAGAAMYGADARNTGMQNLLNLGVRGAAAFGGG